MIKSQYTGVTLDCLMQTREITPSNCPTGMLSKDADGNFLFQEEVRTRRPERNPKLYDGKFVTLVRMRNGKYQMHFKTLTGPIDREHFAFDVYMDVNAALQSID